MAFTFFFRDIHTLERVREFLLPMTQDASPVKIWDAGCAMGPEPFTFLIILAEKMSHFAFKRVQMDATDIDEDDVFGKNINSGIYHNDIIKRIPPEIHAKYFTKYSDNDEYIIAENIRDRIKFHKNDLLDLKPVDKGYKLIICKNVLLHQNASQRIEIIKMFHSVLAPGGLFVCEQTQPMPKVIEHMFEPLASDAQLFRKKEV